MTPGLSLSPHPCNPFALVASLKLGLRQILRHYNSKANLNLLLNCFCETSKKPFTKNMIQLGQK